MALNREVTADLAEALAPVFTEVVVAPSYTPEAREVFARKGNLRVLSGPKPYGSALDLRSIEAADGGVGLHQAGMQLIQPHK